MVILTADLEGPLERTAQLVADRLGATAVTATGREIALAFAVDLRVHLTLGESAMAADLIINAATWTPEQAAQLIVAAVECRPASSGKATGFSHPSEQMFANLLDFYRIPWSYEPRSFPLQWNEAGAVTQAFTPDFYLPESDLYVELTTMRQTLVTRKNRKVRRLKAIYPHINIQIFYQKDFQELLFKYGLRATAD